MRRREFLLVVGATLALARPARADGGRLRIGCAVRIANARSNPAFLAFERRLAELGYGDGDNVIFDYVRVADGSAAEQERGYREAIGRGANLLLTGGPEYSLKAALAVSQTLPVLMIAIDFDPIARGYVKALSEPGGRIAGLFLRQVELAVKRLHFLADRFPDFKSAVVFYDDASRDQWLAVENAARPMAIGLFGVELIAPFDYDRAFASAPIEARKVLLVMASPRFFAEREAQAQFALRQRLTSFFPFRQFVDAGGLMSYGPSLTGIWRRAAELAARIAQGERPGDLPIEQPTKFEFVVNLAAARALGIELSASLLAGADEVIE